MEHSPSNGWRVRKPKCDMISPIQFSTCEDSYKSNGLPYPISKTVTLDSILDTGARTTVAGVELVERLGLNVSNLFQVEQKLCGADNTPLKILGGLFLNIKSRENQTIVLI